MPQPSYLPPNYHSIQPYLIFENCRQAIVFYSKVFGARERLLMPGPDGRVGHAELEFGDSVVMMADESAASSAFAPAHFGGSPIKMMLYVESCDATYRAALEAGAESVREPADQSYGDRMAGIRDPFGYTWFVGTPIPTPALQEA